jgi:hypothetical protein
VGSEREPLDSKLSRLAVCLIRPYYRHFCFPARKCRKLRFAPKNQEQPPSLRVNTNRRARRLIGRSLQQISRFAPTGAAIRERCARSSNGFCFASSLGESRRPAGWRTTDRTNRVSPAHPIRQLGRATGRRGRHGARTALTWGCPVDKPRPAEAARGAGARAKENPGAFAPGLFVAADRDAIRSTG